ncbi:MAG: serine hydrolase [Xanthobacteraceae bacterium]|nr:serine hydrolase [Xanthobacteraceae bacterium]
MIILRLFDQRLFGCTVLPGRRAIVAVAGAALVWHAVLVPAALAQPVNPHAKEPIGTVQQMYDGALSETLLVNTLRNTDRLFPTRTVARGGKVFPLPAGKPLGNVRFVSGGNAYGLQDYVALNRVTGFLVIKDGQVALEQYRLGNTAKTRWLSMSVVKSFTASLVGAAIKDGHIRAIDDQVADYLPVLRGSAYEGVSIRHLIEMASGVKWDETYTDPSSDRRRMLDIQNSQKPGGTLELMASLPRAALPGTRWNYSTGETQVVGALVRAAVGRPVADYLSDRIWARFGMEADATWWLESPDGLEIGGSGLSATLRDFGRLGLFLLGGGKAGNEQILPENWVQEAASPKRIGGGVVNYGYMLWPIPNGEGTIEEGAFEARGIFGQHIYVNPRENLVIVVWSALPKPTNNIAINDNDVFFAIAQALHAEEKSP